APMRITTFVGRALPSVAVLLLSAAPGCGTGPEPGPDAALRVLFPAHAAKVLETGEGFRATEAGFLAGEPAAAGPWSGALRMTLPRGGADGIRMETASGFPVV